MVPFWRRGHGTNNTVLLIINGLYKTLFWHSVLLEHGRKIYHWFSISRIRESHDAVETYSEVRRLRIPWSFVTTRKYPLESTEKVMQTSQASIFGLDRRYARKCLNSVARTHNFCASINPIILTGRANQRRSLSLPSERGEFRNPRFNKHDMSRIRDLPL